MPATTTFHRHEHCPGCPTLPPDANVQKRDIIHKVLLEAIVCARANNVDDGSDAVELIGELGKNLDGEMGKNLDSQFQHARE